MKNAYRKHTGKKPVGKSRKILVNAVVEINSREILKARNCKKRISRQTSLEASFTGGCRAEEEVASPTPDKQLRQPQGQFGRHDEQKLSLLSKIGWDSHSVTELSQLKIFSTGVK
jgi:hypothetical protein